MGRRSRNSNICGCHSSIDDMLKEIQSMAGVSVSYDSEDIESCISEIERLEGILYDIFRAVDFTELMENGLKRRAVKKVSGRIHAITQK